MKKEKQRKAVLEKYKSRNNGSQVYVNNTWTDINDVMMNMVIMNSIMDSGSYNYDSNPSYDSGSSSYDSGGYDSGGCGGGCD